LDGGDVMDDRLSNEEREQLLKLARQAMEDAVCGKRLKPLELRTLPARLQEPGASFITLTVHGDLRGCIGALEPRVPLAEDVREHAVAAALQDPRFPPVYPAELPVIQIEVSRLTLPTPLPYEDPAELLSKLKPGVDGVILSYGKRRATFLPQVWEKIAQPEDFLEHLCMKLGVPPDFWRYQKLEVSVYQVEEFHE
jgi:AmmeMemoRadiSam system protein A